jgi:lysophospholipase L1-like esterase
MNNRHWAISTLLCAILLTGCQNTQTIAPTMANSQSSADIATESSNTFSSDAEANMNTNSESSIAVSSAVSNAVSTSAGADYTPPVLKCVPESEEVSPSFLNKAVFVGDSVTLKLKNYVTKKRKSDPDFFGTAAFLAAGSMGSGNALKPLSEDSIHPYYNGKKELLEDSAAEMGADKVYLMLGINDVAPYGVEGAANNLEQLAKRFVEKIPGVKIYIQSATPMLADKQKKLLNNSNLERYNELLSDICQKNGWYFLDVASVMRDDTGALKKEYCSDPDDLGLHFTDTACEVWIHYILTHTGG